MDQLVWNHTAEKKDLRTHLKALTDCLQKFDIWLTADYQNRDEDRHNVEIAHMTAYGIYAQQLMHDMSDRYHR